MPQYLMKISRQLLGVAVGTDVERKRKTPTSDDNLTPHVYVILRHCTGKTIPTYDFITYTLKIRFFFAIFNLSRVSAIHGKMNSYLS